MSKLSKITGTISIVLLFLALGLFDAHMIISIICMCLCFLFGLPAIIEDRVISDNEFEREVKNDFKV